MTPYRDNKRGTFILDRHFRGVGRLKRASGTTDPKLFGLLDAMLSTLYEGGRVDLLRAIATGTLTPLEVWARFRVNELERLPTAEMVIPLDPGMYDWLKGKQASAHHAAGLKYSIAALLKHARKGATVADLPAVLRKMRAGNKTPRMFNRTRAAVLSYLADTLGKSHSVYTHVRDVNPLKVKRQKHEPLTPQQARELAERLGPKLGPMLWSMAITGMGPGEYWGQWNVKADRVHIGGTKRESRVRDVPRLGTVVPPAKGVTYPAFRLALLRASTGIEDHREASRSPLKVGVYDLRRTFSHWMSETGIPRARRKLYMGHAVADVTDLYELHEVASHLAEDGAKMRHYIGEPDAPGLKVVRGAG